MTFTPRAPESKITNQTTDADDVDTQQAAGATRAQAEEATRRNGSGHQDARGSEQQRQCHRTQAASFGEEIPQNKTSATMIHLLPHAPFLSLLLILALVSSLALEIRAAPLASGSVEQQAANSDASSSGQSSELMSVPRALLLVELARDSTGEQRSRAKEAELADELALASAALSPLQEDSSNISQRNSQEKQQPRLRKRSGISDQRLAEIQMIRALKKQLVERASKLAASPTASGEAPFTSASGASS